MMFSYWSWRILTIWGHHGLLRYYITQNVNHSQFRSLRDTAFWLAEACTCLASARLCPIVMEWKSETIITKYVFFALFVFVYSIFVWQSNLRLVKTNEDKGVSSSVLISPCVGFHAWLSIEKRCRLVLSACPFATKSDMAVWPKTFASAEMAMIACDSHS